MHVHASESNPRHADEITAYFLKTLFGSLMAELLHCPPEQHKPATHQLHAEGVVYHMYGITPAAADSHAPNPTTS